MKKGDLIRGPFWPEPIIVKDTQQIDHRHIYIIGKTQKSNEHIERILDLEDLDKIEIITSQKTFYPRGVESFFIIRSNTLSICCFV